MQPFFFLSFLNMLKVGLTGGIGSGKTTVARIFEILGIPVYYADDRAKKLMNENEALKTKIIQAFGPECYNTHGLNRPYLASKVFSNKEQLELLNSIVHPVTIEDADNWLKKQSTPYAIKEAALMFESNAYKSVEKVIGVSAPYDLRLQRAMVRDNVSEEDIKTRMSKQMDEEEKIKRCDFVVFNDEKQLLIPQVIRLHETLISLAATNN